MSAICLAISSGCIGPWRPSDQDIQRDPWQSDFTIEPFLVATRLGQSIYERHDLPLKPSDDGTLYARRWEMNRTIEGLLSQRPFEPLDKYLIRTKKADDHKKVPRAPLQGGTAVFVELAEAREPIPLDLKAGKPVESTVGITYFDYLGRPQATGTLVRKVEIEGTEDVECPAGRFENCLRIKVDLTVRFPWVLTLDWSSYLWLDPEVGEVRRTQSMSGWFLFLWFGSAHEYRLVSHQRPVGKPPETMSPTPGWKRAAILLKTVFPGPDLSGMVVDFETPIP